jgi:hypothetical protein
VSKPINPKIRTRKSFKDDFNFMRIPLLIDKRSETL